MKKILLVFLLCVLTSNVKGQWVQTGGPSGGSIGGFALSSNNLYAGGYLGTNGIYCSTNNGVSWNALASEISLCYSIAASNSKIIALTYTGNFLSTNSGNNWVNLYLSFLNGNISNAVFSGSNIYLATDIGIFVSTNDGVSFNSINNGLMSLNIRKILVSGSVLFAASYNGGIYKSTNDGLTWVAQNNGLTNLRFIDLAISGSNIIAATEMGQLFLSMNDGQNWSLINYTFPNIYHLAITNSKIFALSTSDIYQSSNNGSSWNIITNLLPNPNVSITSIITSGSNIFLGTDGDGIYFSTNDGLNWVKSFFPALSITDIIEYNSTIFTSSWIGGIFSSTNNGSTWNEMNNGIQIKNILCLEKSGGNIFAGGQKGLYLSTNFGTSWENQYFFIGFDNVYALAISGTNIFAGGNFGILLSTNNGANWNAMNNGLVYDVTCLAVSNSNIFAGTYHGGIYRSTNNGILWTQINNGLSNIHVNSLTVSGSNIFAGTGGGIFLSTDNGISWSSINFGITNSIVRTLHVSGNNVFAGTTGGVFLSTNNGINWNSISSGLPIHSISSLLVSGSNIFAGTNGSSVWRRPLSEILPLSVTQPNGGDTLGGSVYEIKWTAPLNISNVKLEYSKNNGSTWNTIISSTPAANYSYNWTVPNNFTSSQCKIKISNASNSSVYDVSDNSFTISQITLNTGLMAYYPLDNNSNDVSGNNRNGTLMNNCVFENGIINGSIKITGQGNIGNQGGHVILPYINFQTLNNFTISLWVKILSYSYPHGEAFVFFGSDGNGTVHIGNFINNNALDSIGFAVGYDGVNIKKIDTNNFVLYTLVYDNGTLKAYQNGILKKQRSANIVQYGNKAGLGTHWWGAGGNQSTRFIGNLDDVRIYNRSLSQSEIQQLYNQAAPLLVNSPSANENLTAGSPKFINWNASSNISNIKIQFSSNNGSTWKTISNSIPASNNGLVWVVENANSSQCKIKISNASDSNVKAESGTFTVRPSTSQLINFKIKDETGEVKRIKIKSSADELTKDIISNEVKFSYQEIDNMDTDNEGEIDYKIRKINFLKQTGNDVVGFINFDYSTAYLSSQRSIDAVIYVDSKTASQVGYRSQSFYRNDWNYFTSPDEHLVYMIIPPNEKFSGVRNTIKPLLFVHGIYGTYPSWGMQPLQIYNNYDGWQLYYPYDMRITDCSYILKKVIDKILSGEPTGIPYTTHQLINIVSHSMGGLVTRYYIQSNMNQKINKLLMLGTPNNGSLSVHKMMYEGFIFPTIVELFENKDRKSPANIDMTPTSNLMNYLNTSPIKQLNNRTNNKSYLVIAGTKPTIEKFGIQIAIPHHESTNQEDLVVSVSSASLLNMQIPLATSYFNHTELPTGIPTIITETFLDDNYDPNNISTLNNILSNVNGFYLSPEVSLKDANPNFNKSKGILYFTIPGIDLNSGVTISNDQQNSYFLTLENPPNESVYLNKNPEAGINYFIRNNENDEKGGLGLYLNTIQNNVKFTFRRKYRDLFFRTKYLPIPISNNTFEYKPLQTNWLTLNLTESEKHLIKTSSYLFGAAGLSSNNSQIIFYLDNSIDTISFCLSGNIGDTAFINNNFKLTDPNNNLIDSVYASQHPNIIFRQSIEDASVYYYIVNPQPGNWSAQYNSNIAEPFLIAPVQSPVTAELLFSDSAYAATEDVTFYVNVPKEIGILNPQLTADIKCVLKTTNEIIDFGNAEFIRINDTSFAGMFNARFAGEYKIDLELNCIYNNQPVQRKFFNSISVNSIRAPQSIYPGMDSLNTPTELNFVWKKNLNSVKYELEIYESVDTIPAFVFQDITDTSKFVTGLVREFNYVWRIRSMNNTDTSLWSDLSLFTTLKNPPEETELINPPDNTGGLSAPIKLNWKKSSGAEYYHCQISDDSLFSNLVLNDSTITDTIKTVTNLNYPVKYFWRVRTINSGGSSDFSVTRTFRTIQSSSTSVLNVTLIPQGFYNLNTNSLNLSDTVKCYLANIFSPYSIVDSSASILDSTDFQAAFNFQNASTGIYFIKIIHRNSIETWSKDGGESFAQFGTTYFDFTSNASQAFGNNLNQADTSPLRFAIFSGDVNQDGSVDLSDLTTIDNDAINFVFGYVSSDVNGDGAVDLSDLTIADNNAFNYVGKIVPQ